MLQDKNLVTASLPGNLYGQTQNSELVKCLLIYNDYELHCTAYFKIML